jgi:hypothetical protein
MTMNIDRLKEFQFQGLELTLYYQSHLSYIQELNSPIDSPTRCSDDHCPATTDIEHITLDALP